MLETAHEKFPGRPIVGERAWWCAGCGELYSSDAIKVTYDDLPECPSFNPEHVGWEIVFPSPPA